MPSNIMLDVKNFNRRIAPQARPAVKELFTEKFTPGSAGAVPGPVLPDAGGAWKQWAVPLLVGGALVYWLSTKKGA